MSEPRTTPTPDSGLPHAKHRQFGVGTLLLSVSATAVVVGVSVAWLSHLGHAPATATTAAPQARYTCPMHPSIVQNHPGNCPICGMSLVKVDGAGGAEGQQLAGKGETSSRVPGQATVMIDPARQQLIGLTTSQATTGQVGGTWRTVGRVAVDETRVRHINVKVPTFVERVYVDFVGKAVKKGEPLFSVYSPDLLAAQEEYLLALRTAKSLSEGGALAKDGDLLVKAARRRLELWDIPASEIDRIAATGEATKTLTFFSPVSGVVTKKDVVEGMRLEAGAMPYEIVDLSVTWVLADIYENELRFVRVGMPATLTLNAFPSREFKGKVLFIDPLLDPLTRTVKVRLAFPNPAGELKPQMFGEVVIHGEPREGVRIPENAVVDSGTVKFVFVALGDGKFQPRAVQLGEASGDMVEVTSGLEAGDEVVTRANFLVDSESRLRASLAAMTAGAKESAPERARVLGEPEKVESPAPSPPPSNQQRVPPPAHQGH